MPYSNIAQVVKSALPHAKHAVYSMSIKLVCGEATCRLEFKRVMLDVYDLRVALFYYF